MNLTPDILYYRCLQSMDVLFEKRPELPIRVGRPVFLTKETPISQAVIITTAQEWELLSISEKQNYSQCVILYLEDPNDFESEEAEHSWANCLEQEVPDCAVFVVKSALPIGVIFNTLQEIYNLFDAWEQEMNQIYYENKGFSELLDSCDAILYDPICIMDSELKYVSYSHKSYERGLVSEYVTSHQGIPEEFIHEFIQISKNDTLNTKREPFRQVVNCNGIKGIFQNLFCENDFIGRLILSMEQDEETKFQYHCDVILILAHYVEAMYRKFHSFRRRKTRLNPLRNLLSDCIHQDSSDVMNWKLFSQELGWSSTDCFQVIQFNPKPRYGNNMYSSYIIEEIEDRGPGALCFQHSGKLFLLIDHTRLVPFNDESFYQNMACFLRDHLMTAGVSREFHNLNHFVSACKQTDIALQFGMQLDPTMWYFRFDTYALTYLLQKGSEEFAKDPEMLCSPKLMILRKADQENHAQYYKTLFTYFQCKWNASAASEALYIHRSTFINRMERIQNLTAIDFQSSDELLYLAISFKILENTATQV